MTIALLLVLALFGAGCGGGDDTASNTDTVVTETTEDITIEEETGNTTDGGSIETGDCAELVAVATQVGQVFAATGETADVEEAKALFQEFAESGPEEIRDDLRVLAEAYDEYAEVLADVNVEPGQVPDADTIQEFQAALASIDQVEVTAASQRISTWTNANC